jgi:hypothetical protein
MLTHRNPRPSVSKQAPSDNFNPSEAFELLYSEMVEVEAHAVAPNQRHEHAAPTARTVCARRSRRARRRADAVRGATITALIALLDVIAILGACIVTGGAR